MLSQLKVPSAAERSWYLLQSKPRQTDRALEHLERQGYSCYLPTHSVERIVRGKRQLSLEPLFANYLFIQLCENYDNWMPLRSTRGVSKLVRFGEYPLKVSEQIINSIRQREKPIAQCFSKGDKVRITEGSFAELEAIFLAHDGEERAILLLNLLHRENLMHFPLSSLRKL